MTVKDAVISAREELMQINVPAAELRAMGNHLLTAIDILDACVFAMEKVEAEEQAKGE